jgi:glucans biosynthesis protein C
MQDPAYAIRLTELDWVRIAAFGLLILYHVGMFYVPWDWHVKSPQPVPALQAWMALLSPWRLPLLFVVSGAATGLMLVPGAAIARVRSRRLLWPLLFGVVVVVPPQSYLEVVQKLGYAGSYSEFLRLYFSGFHGFCRDGQCLVLPTWNHLWFVAYLWVYTMLLLAWQRVCGQGWRAAPGWRRLLGGARLLWVPWLALACIRMALRDAFPPSNDLVYDWYNHAVYGTLFALGCLLFGQREDRHGAWADAVRLRWWALGLALAVHFGLRAWGDWFGSWDTLHPAARAALRALRAGLQWAPIVAVLGFARLHLAGRDGPARRWLTEAVFPFYIVHQTTIVLAAPQLVRLGWPQPLEAAVLVLLTALACVASVLCVRRLRWLRPLFGLAPAR